jgi:formimidoylglutamate deiminase
MIDSLYAQHALLPDGWAQQVKLSWNAAGDLVQVRTNCALSDSDQHGNLARATYVIPGMVNLHSHAFQRAMTGLAENAGQHGADNFWSWRSQMYRLALSITPAQMQAIAAQLYSECLRHGYTSICEFHYLQRAADGAFYANKIAMAEALLQAATQTGIGISLLPVLYSHADFNDAPLASEQRRFATSVQDLLDILHLLEPHRDAQIEIGIAPHSLRAANLAQIRELLSELPQERPIHIHIAEQQKEVAACLAATGQRPVAYLLQGLGTEHGVDQQWCLVHATHLSANELQALAQSQAVVGLCPSTEANLGDGWFDLADYVKAGGRFGIGSDSHVSQSPIEELRWLEYGQRLRSQQRHVIHSAHLASAGGSIGIGRSSQAGEFLWQAAALGGAQASARRVGQLALGYRADFLVLDEAHPNLQELAPETVMNTLIFSGNDNLVRDVVVGGKTVVSAGRHLQQAQIQAAFVRCMRQLRAI